LSDRFESLGLERILVELLLRILRGPILESRCRSQCHVSLTPFESVEHG